MLNVLSKKTQTFLLNFRAKYSIINLIENPNGDFGKKGDLI